MRMVYKCPPASGTLAGTVTRFLLQCGTKVLPALLLAAIFNTRAFCQRASASLDRDKIVIGEQVTLTLQVTDINPRLSFLANWFNLPDTINHLSIIKKDAVDTIDVGGLATYLQHITITSFDSGRWAIPLQSITVQDKTTGKTGKLTADSMFLQVLPVDVSDLKDYHDIKDIIDVPKETDYTLIIAAAASVIAVVVLLILLLKRKKKPASAPKKPKSLRAPLDEALFKLDELAKEGFVQKDETKLFFIRLDDICREYLAARIHTGVMHFTREELMPVVAIYLTDRQMKDQFRQLVQLIDAAKFAKYAPGVGETTDALHKAALILKYIDSQIQLAKQHAN